MDPINIGTGLVKAGVGKAIKNGKCPLHPKAVDFAYGNGDGVLNWDDVTYNVERAGAVVDKVGDVVDKVGDVVGDVVESVGDAIIDFFA